MKSSCLSTRNQRRSLVVLQHCTKHFLICINWHEDGLYKLRRLSNGMISLGSTVDNPIHLDRNTNIY